MVARGARLRCAMHHSHMHPDGSTWYEGWGILRVQVPCQSLCFGLTMLMIFGITSSDSP